MSRTFELTFSLTIMLRICNFFTFHFMTFPLAACYNVSRIAGERMVVVVDR